MQDWASARGLLRSLCNSSYWWSGHRHSRFRFGIINQRMVGNFNHGLIVYIYRGILGIDARDISAIIYINVTSEFIVLYRDFFLFFHGVFCRVTGDDEGIKINVD